MDQTKFIQPTVYSDINNSFAIPNLHGSGNGNGSNMPNVSIQLNNIETRLDKIEPRLDKIELRLDKIDISMEYIKKDLKELKSFRWWFLSFVIMALIGCVAIFNTVSSAQINSMKEIVAFHIENTEKQMILFREDLKEQNQINMDANNRAYQIALEALKRNTENPQSER
jgi:1,2-phenylacetyl-CoA epoxidase catalytic subunit